MIIVPELGTSESGNIQGRPPLEINEEVCEKAESLASQGMTMEQIALALGMGESTLYNKKVKFPEFSEAIVRGQAKGIAHVTNSLFNRATGYSFDEEKMYSSDGKEIGTKTRHLPPDIPACKTYLQNRAGWTEKTEVDNKNPQTVIITTREEYEKELERINAGKNINKEEEEKI